jgi:L-rhamnose mutarotase
VELLRPSGDTEEDLMPENIDKLPKCEHVSTDGSPCLAPRLKNSTYCRWHTKEPSTKATRRRLYMDKLQKLTAQLSADPNELEKTIQTHVQIVATLIDMVKECHADNYKFMMLVLKLMKALQEGIALQEHLEATKAAKTDKAKRDRDVYSLMRECMSPEQFTNFQNKLSVYYTHCHKGEYHG